MMVNDPTARDRAVLRAIEEHFAQQIGVDCVRHIPADDAEWEMVCGEEPGRQLTLRVSKAITTQLAPYAVVDFLRKQDVARKMFRQPSSHAWLRLQSDGTRQLEIQWEGPDERVDSDFPGSASRRRLSSHEQVVLKWLGSGGTLWMQVWDGRDEALLRLSGTTRSVPAAVVGTMFRDGLLKPKPVSASNYWRAPAMNR